MIKKCRWKIKESETTIIYKTSCYNSFGFNQGTFLFNGFKYCPFCGKLIIEDV
jgi:hypothetical protein